MHSDIEYILINSCKGLSIAFNIFTKTESAGVNSIIYFNWGKPRTSKKSVIDYAIQVKMIKSKKPYYASESVLCDADKTIKDTKPYH